MEREASNVVRVLTRAIELLKRGWSQENTAMKKGRICSYADPDATHFSPAGAVHRAQMDLKLEHRYHRLTLQYVNSKVSGGLADFSRNAKSADEVIQEFQRILALARTEKPAPVTVSAAGDDEEDD